jgi:transcription elongation factor GreA
MDKFLTAEGLEKFQKELDYLENTKRKEIAERIRYTASFGDLKENAGYHEAKDSQAFMEGRILELKNIIATARVVKKSDSGFVGIGSTVVLHSQDRQDEFMIVDPQEADIFSNKLSYRSPLGAKLMNKAKGDQISVQTPGGVIEYTIWI